MFEISNKIRLCRFCGAVILPNDRRLTTVIRGRTYHCCLCCAKEMNLIKEAIYELESKQKNTHS